MVYNIIIIFLSSLNEFGPDPNLDQRKTVFRYFNLLPYEYSIEDNVKTALMWVRMYFMKHFTIKTYSSEDATLTDLQRGMLRVENYRFAWQDMVGYLRFFIVNGCYSINV